MVYAFAREGLDGGVCEAEIEELLGGLKGHVVVLRAREKFLRRENAVLRWKLWRELPQAKGDDVGGADGGGTSLKGTDDVDGLCGP